nr:MAG TPA: hypothetical protein [Caudoviricetes sp.]
MVTSTSCFSRFMLSLSIPITSLQLNPALDIVLLISRSSCIQLNANHVQAIHAARSLFDTSSRSSSMVTASIKPANFRVSAAVRQIDVQHIGICFHNSAGAEHSIDMQCVIHHVASIVNYLNASICRTNELTHSKTFFLLKNAHEAVTQSLNHFHINVSQRTLILFEQFRVALPIQSGYSSVPIASASVSVCVFAIVSGRVSAGATASAFVLVGCTCISVISNICFNVEHLTRSVRRYIENIPIIAADISNGINTRFCKFSLVIICVFDIFLKLTTCIELPVLSQSVIQEILDRHNLVHSSVQEMLESVRRNTANFIESVVRNDFLVKSITKPRFLVLSGKIARKRIISQADIITAFDKRVKFNRINSHLLHLTFISFSVVLIVFSVGSVVAILAVLVALSDVSISCKFNINIQPKQAVNLFACFFPLRQANVCKCIRLPVKLTNFVSNSSFCLVISHADTKKSKILIVLSNLDIL